MFKGPEGAFLGTQLGAGTDRKRLFGIHIPSLDTGGDITRDGLAFVHAGERVLNRSETRNTQNSVVVNAVVSSPDPRQFFDQLRALKGSYGLGISDDAWVT